MAGNGNDWDEYRKFVIEKLDDHDRTLRDVHELQRETLTAIATLKVKASLWGAVAGSVPVLLMVAIWLVIKALAN